MNYFDKYVSNTLAGTSNQMYFSTNYEVKKGRIYIKPFSYGIYEYSLMFSDTIDSTYADGSISVANETCGDWTIHSLKACVKGENSLVETPIYFQGNIEKKVEKGGIFYTDPVILNVTKENNLYFEIEFSGGKIPYLEEININTYVLNGDEWALSNRIPLPNMIGIACNVEKKIGFFGDSITQGLGTEKDSYTHWNAYIASKIGEQYSYWNLGIGFGRAADAASNGAWLNKAKKMDVVTICYGVNDLGRGYTNDEIKSNLKRIVEILQSNETRTILFTIPPFDYDEATTKRWKEINDYILNELSQITEVYDVVPIWGMDSPNENRARYGGHPNKEGCLALANDFIKRIQL